MTKLLTAYAVLLAVEEGAVDWDTPAGPEGPTMRHLIAHTSGLNATEPRVVTQPGTRRIYSTPGFEVLAADLARFAAELQSPALVAPETLAEATQVAFPGLRGAFPGYGRQDPNDWGLGFELRGIKSPHWTGRRSSPGTFGHFGQSGRRRGSAPR